MSSAESETSTNHSEGSQNSIVGVVNPTNSSKKGKAKASTSRRSAPRTSWTAPELDEFIRLLQSHRASTGDSGFKDETFNKIAVELNTKFPSQRVPKMGRACHSKWTNIKSEFSIVNNIKNSLGFHYDDTNGAVVDEKTQAAWETFCKHHPGAMKYKGRAWPYWNDVYPLMSAIPKKAHIHRSTKAKPRSKKKDRESVLASPIIAPASVTQNSDKIANTASATVVATDPMIIDSDMTADNQPTAATPTATDPATDPNSIAPSTPSAYLSRPPNSTVSMASSSMTSVSQKHRVSSIVDSNAAANTSAASGSSRKRSRLSVTMQLKADAVDVLQRLSNFVENMDPSFLQPVTLASLGLQQTLSPPLAPDPTTADEDYVDRAGDLLMTFQLTPSENNDIANYMSDPRHKQRVKFFLKFDQPSRELWIKYTLEEIRLKKAKNDADVIA